jgi:hypothetical protein
MSSARQRLNRLFFVTVICWAFFCLFVQPILMAREGTKHYESDMKFCYENYSDIHDVKTCGNRADGEFARGLYAGFGEEYDAGRSWSYGWFFRVRWGLLLIEIVGVPALIYAFVWSIIRVSIWIWRGPKPKPSSAL